ncbi:MAG: cytochrome C oxidase subunit I [Alphaproteobacteria bacterium BRH_c36]|nr:MAG: cytochrome C oxidase subunit I [Alphaproteobacteria bacterium BRH_c36]
MATIRNPVEWSMDRLRRASRHTASIGRSIQGSQTAASTRPEVRKLTTDDVWTALKRGFEDFQAFRTDVLFLCLIYPLIGIVLAWSTFHYRALPLLAPMAFGFALLGPIAAVGLYEMSRRREQGKSVSWVEAFALVRSPSFGAIVVVALILLGVFLAWLTAAQMIYQATLGPEPPASVAQFIEDVFTTRAGWTMMLAGDLVGFLFAVLVLSVSVITFPMLLDRNVGAGTAMATSLRVVMKNPVTMATWGLVVAGGLFVGMLPLFLGLIIVMPVLGHATWHLYRLAVAPE